MTGIFYNENVNTLLTSESTNGIIYIVYRFQTLNIYRFFEQETYIDMTDQNVFLFCLIQ